MQVGDQCRALMTVAFVHVEDHARRLFRARGVRTVSGGELDSFELAGGAFSVGEPLFGQRGI